MEDFIRQYFVAPILERSGYNAVNTLAYAAIALVSLYAIWRFMKGRGFDFSSKEFLYGTAAFVLFGSTARVLTDLSDSGLMAAAANAPGALGAVYGMVEQSRIFEYGYLTVTPGIYIVVAALFLLSIAVGLKLRRPMLPAYAGIALWLPCILLLLPFGAHYPYVALGVLLAAAGSAAAYFLLSKAAKMKLGLHEKLAIAGQALDGAATFVVIDVFAPAVGRGYFEQHVLSAGIGDATPLGYLLFFAVKVALASAIAYFISKEKMDRADKSLVLVVVAIMGFAPGIRDLLRMLAGT